MKETKIKFEDTVPVKETKIKFEDTVPVKETKIKFEDTVIEEVPKKKKKEANPVSAFFGGIDIVTPVKRTFGGYLQWLGEDLKKGEKRAANDPILNFFFPDTKKKYEAVKPNPNLKRTADTGKKIVQEADQKVAKKKEKLGIKHGSLSDKAFNIGQGVSSAVPMVGATLLTKSPAPIMAYGGVSSFTNTYATNRATGADEEKSYLSALGAGSVDVVAGAIQAKWLLNPGKSFIREILKQGLGGAAVDEVGELLKIGLDKGTVTPEMTLKDAYDRLVNTGVVSLGTNALQSAVSYPIMVAPRYKANKAAEAAHATLKAMGEQEVKQPRLNDPKPLSEAELDDIYSGSKTLEEALQEKSEVLIKPREESMSYNLEETSSGDKLKALKEKIQSSEEADGGAASAKIKENDPSLSEFYTNTVKRTTELSEETKSQLIPENFRKDPQKVQDWENKAKEDIDTDLEGTIAELSRDTQGFSGGEESVKSAYVVKKLAEEAESTGDYSKLNDFAAIHAEKLGNSARALKAGDTSWDKTRSPEAALVKAHREVNKAKNKILEGDPNFKGKIPKLNPEDAKFIVDTVNKIKDLPDRSTEYLRGLYRIRQRIAKRLTQGASGKVSRVLLEYSNTNLLSSPSSVLWVNPIGNTLRTGWDTLKAYGYGVTDLAIRRNPQMFKEANARLAAEFAAVKHMFTYRDPNGKGIIDSFIEILQNPRLLDENMAISSLSGEESITNELGSRVPALSSDYLKDPDAPVTMPWQILDYLGVGGRAISVHALQAFDNIAEQVNYFGEARAEVSRKAYESGLVGKQRADYETKLFQDVLDYLDGRDQSNLPSQQMEIVKEIHESCVEYAKEATWKGKMAKPLEDASRYLNEHPTAKLLAARFFRTPVNIMKWGIIDNSPLALLQKQVRRDISGANGYESQMKAWVNQAAGAALWTGLAGLVISHRITGSHAPKERKDKLAAGIPEFSIDLTGKGDWINYRRIEPLATPLSLIASFHEISHYLEDKDYENYSSTLALAMGNSIYSSTMLRQLGDMMRLLDEGYRLQDKNVFEQYAINQMNAYLPASGLSRGINRGALGVGKDPYIREVETITDKLVDTYAPYKLNPKLNTITGQPVENEGEFLGMTLGETDWDNPGVVKMAQLEMSVGEPNKKLFGVKLDQQQHWEYQRMIDTEFHLADRLNELVQQEGFDDLPTGVQKDAIRDLINSIRSAAGFKFLNDNNLLDKIPKAKEEEVMEYLQPSKGTPWSEQSDFNDWFN